MHASARGSCIASYRTDVSMRVWPYLVPATILTMLGALGVCTAFVSHGALARSSDLLTFAGALCMLIGLLLGLMIARPIFTHDEYVAALERGLLWKIAGAESFLDWEKIETLAWDAAAGALVILPREGERIAIVRSFARASGPQLAAALEDVRRKASFNLVG